MSSDESEDSCILLEMEPSTIQLRFSPPSSPESQTPLEDEDAPQPIVYPRILCVTSLYGKGENFEHWAEQNGLEEWGSHVQQCLVSEEGLHAKVNEEEGCIHSTDGQIREGNSGDDQDRKDGVRDVQQVIFWKEPPKEQERGNKQMKEEKGNERVDEEKGNVQVKEEKRVNEDGEERAGGEEAKTLQGEETANRCEVSRSIGIQDVMRYFLRCAVSAVIRTYACPKCTKKYK
ncbi:hypothetical protein J4Q44_G00061070 [Coregonus suidteri]|uniref:Uncharacterized protein n=1 Tax=Coregonus suidteri TaxID=861788 RepID=A0AAN8MCH6_9TELE